MATLLKVLNNLADIRSARGVALHVRTQGLLDQFQDRIAEHDLTGGQCEVIADGERLLVDLRGKTGVVVDVIDEILQSVDQVLAALFSSLLQSGRISEKRVSRGQRIGHQRDGEAGPVLSPVVECGTIDEPLERVGPGHIALEHHSV